MIPVRLRLRNFMCYREDVPPLDFRGVHLACLCGDNGNGKSALIDAMTWALWGKARAGSIDELVSDVTGVRDMEVEFDFAVGPDLYRVLRKRIRPRKRTSAGQSSLDLFAVDGDNARALSGAHIDETQQQIIDLLHMDYDTFVNSAYLRQGHADEFTRQPAGKRKDVLAAILDLGRYDELEEKARDLAREYDEQSRVLESGLEEIAGELAKRPEIEASCAEARETLKGLDATAKEAEEKLTGLRKRLDALEDRQARLDDLTARAGESERQLATWEEQAAGHRAGIERYEAVIARREEIEQGAAACAAARKTYEEMTALSQRDAKLRLRISGLNAAVNEARITLVNTLDKYQQKVTELEERVQALPELRRQREEARQKAEALAAREKTVRDGQAAVRDGQAAVSRLEADIERLEREIGEVGEKLDLLARHRESHEEARCPLCESELTQEGLALIESKYTRERGEKTAALAQQKQALAEAGPASERLKNAQAGMEADLQKEQNALRIRMEVLEKDISERESDEGRLPNGRKYVADVTGQLERKGYAPAEQEQLAAAEKELADLGYDEAKHEDARRQADELQKWEREKTTLDEAARLIEAEQTGLARAEENIAALREQAQQAGEQQEALRKELEELPALREETAAAETAHRDAAAARDEAREAVGKVSARLEQLKELEARKQEREQSLAAAARDAGIYKELTRAFGKTGIQALLIESALPDIENEANRLLARMTDNRMSVNFKTQDETKAGKPREVLDIMISDELGTRDYEMFSGGEAFRINFAIRIALSRLLASRAGAPLPTLIIDEGFGTQDSAGLEKLKEAINSIQDDFEKILVITHMDELKDAFPTRIEVVKSGGGSVITVS
jgi:exonuclease SbcC